MNGHDSDKWRHKYLRILTGRADQDFNSQEDLQAIEDLVDEKLIRGSAVRGIEGIVRGAALVKDDNGHTVPTLKGRLFIADQKAFLRSKTFFGRIKANWPLFSGIFGIIIGWSLGLVSPLIQQRFYPQIQKQLSATPATNLTQEALTQPKSFPPPATSVTPIPTKP